MLGRPFLEQRTKTSAKDENGAYTDHTDVHVALDLQGRASAVSARYVPAGGTEPVSQPATTDVFDLLGRSLRHVRRDAQSKDGDDAVGGTTWVLPAIDGQPVRRWDSRDQVFRNTFDALRRPTSMRVTVGTSDEVCLSFLRYGEEAPDAAERHLLGQTWKVYDTAGLIVTEAVDVDGHVTESTRRHVARYFPLPDWTAHAAAPDTATDPDWVQTADGADDEVYTQTATFDVAGRPVADGIWRDASAKHERRYAYDAGGRLTGVDVRLRSTDAGDWRPVVHDVTYNARGQRVVVRTGDASGAAAVQTDHSYDPETFRLLRIRTERLSDDAVLQDYRWVHDAVGNITFQENQGDDTIWYDNGTIAPHRAYRYDALDRLIEATGREHASTFDTSAGYPGSQGQTSAPYGTGPVAHKADGTALRSYTQTYTYDDVGNFLELRHVQGGAGGVTSVRTYAYTVESDGSLFNNQLHRTTVGSTNYDHTYDLHGNTTELSHLPDMAWDPLDRLHSVQTQARTQDIRPDPERAPAHDWFYLYDGTGQRVRKVRAVLVEYDAVGDPGVLVADGVLRSEERLYVGPFEVWRKYNLDGSTDTERETLHVMDDQRRVAMVETLTWEDDAAVGTPVGRWRYQLDDHLGTSCGEVTESGLEIGWEEYHPYGTTALSSFDATREVSGKRYRYTGMERDDETGLAYHSARFLLPGTARWISVDPLGVACGVNTYSYSSENPISRYDKSGTEDVPTGLDLTRLAANVRASPEGLAVETLGELTIVAMPLTSEVNNVRVTGTMRSFAVDQTTSGKYEVMVNGQMYGKLGYPEGSRVDGGVKSGYPENETFYFALDVETGDPELAALGMVVPQATVSTGLGEPPENVDFAIGGVVPVIINGLKYGRINRYTSDAPVGLPETGDAGVENHKYYTQRSSRAFASVQNKPAGVGLPILAADRDTGLLLIVVQEHREQAGRNSLAQVRDALVAAGVDEAVLLDGSDSATLTVQGREYAAPGWRKNLTIPMGVGINTNGH